MEIRKTVFGNKSYLVSSKGRRLTKSYWRVEMYAYGNYAVVRYHNLGETFEKHKLFDTKSEVEISGIKVLDFSKINDSHFVLRLKGEYQIWNQEGFLRGGIKSWVIEAGKGYYYAMLEDGEHFLNSEFNSVSEAYDSICSFDKFGYAYAKRGTTRFVIDENMQVVLKLENVRNISAISKELFVVSKNNMQGVVNKKGEYVVEPIYTTIVKLEGKYIIVKYNNNFGIVDIEGNVIFETIYDEIIETPNKFVVKDFAHLELARDKVVIK